MRARVPLLIVVLVACAGGFACDRSPTSLPQPAAPSSQTCPAPPIGSPPQPVGSGGNAVDPAPQCVQPTVGLQAERSNYAVAW